MDQGTISKITRKVSRQFPEMKGVRPSVRQQSTGKNGRGRYLLTYKGKVNLPGGRKLNRVVRVVANAKGKVIRMSTSR